MIAILTNLHYFCYQNLVLHCYNERNYRHCKTCRLYLNNSIFRQISLTSLNALTMGQHHKQNILILSWILYLILLIQFIIYVMRD